MISEIKKNEKCFLFNTIFITLNTNAAVAPIATTWLLISEPFLDEL